jgi:serine/threonine protein kinase/formylglycine-generating enzyme required for sulfatase activity
MSADAGAFEELVTQYLAEKRRGEALDLETLVRRHPEHSHRLRDVLRGMELMQRAANAFSVEDARQALDGPSESERELSASGDLGAASPGRARATDDFITRVLSEVQAQGISSRRYTSEGEIARGGQGAVLAVRDSTLNRTLAMKVALASGRNEPGSTPSDARSLGRFLEEAQVTAQLDHPGIVPVHELGLDPEKRVYFTMKLVKGRDLRGIFEMVRTGAEDWTQTRALSVLLKVCEAMSYAHSKGVIHRDLKPSNVMVGKFGEVYVMDWGLARVLGTEDRKDIRIRPALTSALSSARHEGDDDLESPLVTMDGDVVGTPAFMPPEQARGELAAMGPHSDVYAVGAMLYQLLTGEMPYVRAGSRLSNRAVWALVQRGPPEPVHALAPRIPAELAAICEKAMARDVVARYPDMSALAADLRAYLEHQVVGAYETGAVAELRKWVRRNRSLAGALAAVFVAVVAGLVTSLVFKGKADAHASSVLRLSALQELEDLTAEADRLWPARPGQVEAYREWIRKAEGLAGDLPRHEARLAALRAQALPWTEEERADQRARHPRLVEFEHETMRLAFLRRLVQRRSSTEEHHEPTPEDVGLSPAEQPDVGTANEMAWKRVDPDRTTWGDEALGLVLARNALERATDLPLSSSEWGSSWWGEGYETASARRASIRDTLAWALFANGRFEEAMEEERRAVEEGRAEGPQLLDWLAKLERAVAEHSGEEGKRRVTELEERAAALEEEVGQRWEWRFADSETRWWHSQQEKLVHGIEDLTEPATGLLSRGISPVHGWGVSMRLEFALSLEERSLLGADDARRWREALDSIADPQSCPAYGGLRIAPQLGLVPIGRDPSSGLWEFAHLDSGDPAERGPDGNLILTERSGIVLVLLPGGKFLMGAQATDPDGPNYDPQALPSEAPVHEVTLSPFFLSKYEMTQGQWLHFTGRNPSFHNTTSLLHPAEQVSWEDCTRVLLRMGLMLPSEAHWEYGARGGTTTPWWTGADRSTLLGNVNLADQAAVQVGLVWYDAWDWPELNDGFSIHAPVNTFDANPFGLHQVCGNIAEWCMDLYSPYSSQPVTDPVGTVDYRTRALRGGDYRHRAFGTRSSFRGNAPSSTLQVWHGVRPARRVEGEIVAGH